MKSSWDDKIAVLFETKLHCDVELIVSDNKASTIFKAHKIILKMCSEFFSTLFGSHFLESKSNTVKVTAAPEIFEMFLELIYTNNIKLTSCEQAIALYKLGDQLLSPLVTAYCYKYIFDNINDNTACICYEFSILYSLKKLEDYSLRVIPINCQGFLHLSESSIVKIVSDGNVLAREFDLFEAIAKWIQHKGEKSKEYYRNLLIPKFHYFNMTPKEFCDGPISSGLLKGEEILAILANLTSQDCRIPFPEGFPQTLRGGKFRNCLQGPQEVRVLFEEAPVFSRHLNRCSGFISVKEDVIISGLKLSCRIKTKYLAKDSVITLKINDKTLTIDMSQCLYADNALIVNLSLPVALWKDKIHTIEIDMSSISGLYMLYNFYKAELSGTLSNGMQIDAILDGEYLPIQSLYFLPIGQ
ncbi:BTB/POZ domain-containing protein 2-like [Cimex lectularius]|uniref:BTB domain-containing protein n=1 Tax=Cimex lectularius TaxID=79782 RepID=A0A8I6RCX4_CIMLE|nr:BTB/POZ domain-containing protein 2-like [Cimex lectularius]XP_014242842.1 BTB/POZ domain-containing protein 2-like [Cimex lectularius]XP_024081924.1 BTB/POZ domain-containing protein 2-like [Cimex lectularius]